MSESFPEVSLLPLVHDILHTVEKDTQDLSKKNEDSLLASVFILRISLFLGGMHKKLKQSFTTKKAVHFCAHCSSKCYRRQQHHTKGITFLGLFKSCCGISTHTAYFLQNSAHWLHTYCYRFQHFRYSPIYATCAACELCNPHVCLSPFSRNIISDFS